MSRDDWEITCRPDRGLQRGLRDAVREKLAAWNLAREAVNKVLLAVDEIVGNSIDHGFQYRQSSNEIAVRLTLEVRDLRVVIVDPDTPEPVVRELDRRLADANEPPALDAERGRGMFLIRSALEDVRFEWQSGRGMTISGFVRGVT